MDNCCEGAGGDIKYCGTNKTCLIYQKHVINPQSHSVVFAEFIPCASLLDFPLCN